MLKMFRLRRYRIFLIFAALFTFLVFRYVKQHDLKQLSSSESLPANDLPLAQSPKQNGFEEVPAVKPTSAVLPAKAGSTESSLAWPLSTEVVVQPAKTTSTSAQVPTIPPLATPDRKSDADKGTSAGTGADEIHAAVPDGKQQDSLENEVATIHWQKQVEHFPVPSESIIPLPTGALRAIPKIQHKFNDETPDAKINREKRQNKVKEEFQKAWAGYRKKAWLHDELTPVSGGARDPFCGWAATLVDSLDTLWIMGLETEFEEAAKAVSTIDFTTSTRADIPVFETTIRYLGGLLAAYDVSGGKYTNLLDKAVELADILMGAFDTPNRMPVLFYQWKPAFASQPHRAGQRANLAELGSLTLEFTRLAQLTKEPRYYDAVARVTTALEEYQKRGTRLGGIFPENVDASGCNRTAPPTMPIAPPVIPVTPADSQAPEGYKPTVPGTVEEPKPKKLPTGDDPDTLEMKVISGQPSKAHLSDYDESHKVTKRASKRAALPLSNRNVDLSPVKDPKTGLLVPANSQGANSLLDDGICEPQGIESSSGGTSDKFSMGGGQDSTYEYFPKQYMLLGGRVEGYREMYLKTIKAVKEHLLYRPMVPDNRDILFTGAIQTSIYSKELTLAAEVEHLTCFIGGMVGMAAKIFELEGDLEVAKKLTDGCVWAYGSTATGIMPEGSTVIACENAEHCAWNETAYHQYLDPTAKDRDRILAEYLASTEKMAAEAQAQDVIGSASVADSAKVSKRTTYEEKVDLTAKELQDSPSGRQAEVPLAITPSKTTQDGLADPLRPQSHKEYVETLIKQASLPPGMVSIRGKAYILRPEAIESVWYMYRITGDTAWQDKGWTMFEAIINHTSTAFGHSAISDVTSKEPYHNDQMESFWLAETLKYFYLLYSTPDTISLDEYVLNTEAHPFKRET